MDKKQLATYEYVVKTAMKTLGISREQAEARTWIIINSGLLLHGGPEDSYSQMMIENFMRFDPNRLDYTQMFKDTMNFPELTKEYDKKFRRNLTVTLDNARKNPNNSDLEKLKYEIQEFDKFFKENIFDKYPKHDA